MRRSIALCVGLLLLLGAGAAWAGVGIGECGVCECAADGRRLCMQDEAVNRSDCENFCGSTDVIDFSAGFVQCSDVPGCPQSFAKSAPAASPYGVIALLLSLSALGMWRLRRRSLPR